MTASTPRFGSQLGPDERQFHMANFGAEAYEFTDFNWKRARYVGILYLGKDLGAARPEMDEVVRVMKKQGYDLVKHDQGVNLSDQRGMVVKGSCTAMIVISSDDARYPSVRYVPWCVSVGWFGLVPYWDVLWYGTDYVPEPNREHLGPDARIVDPPAVRRQQVFPRRHMPDARARQKA